MLSLALKFICFFITCLSGGEQWKDCDFSTLEKKIHICACLVLFGVVLILF